MTEDMITVDEAAEFFRCNTKTIYDAIKLGQLPGAVRLGRLIRVHKPTMLAWVGSGNELPKPRKKR
jgi:excisionase family DNA binding protein